MRNDKEVKTVVQPDLCVICDPSKLDERGCNGAPDLIIEILSPGNSRTEMRENLISTRRRVSLNIGSYRPSKKPFRYFNSMNRAALSAYPR